MKLKIKKNIKYYFNIFLNKKIFLNMLGMRQYSSREIKQLYSCPVWICIILYTKQIQNKKNMAKSRSWQGKSKEMRRNSAEQASDFKDFGGV
jgi:hypothetical protein